MKVLVLIEHKPNPARLVHKTLLLQSPPRMIHEAKPGRFLPSLGGRTLQNISSHKTRARCNETNEVVSSISGKEIHQRTSPNPLQLENSLSEVKCWVARETNILYPECGCKLDVTRSLSKHMKTHQRVEGNHQIFMLLLLRYLQSCKHCQR